MRLDSRGGLGRDFAVEVRHELLASWLMFNGGHVLSHLGFLTGPWPIAQERPGRGPP
jgi:hypothetical protein